MSAADEVWSAMGEADYLQAFSAHPKIGDYPFTTLTPNLGVVQLSDDRTFVVAGLNVVNPKQAGILWRLKDMTQLEANREVMVDHLMHMGFQFSNS